MGKGYWIIRANVTDPEKYAEYAKRTPKALEKYGGTFLVRAGEHRVVEGNSWSRNSIIEFPTYRAAMECWNSPEYQNAKVFRAGAAEMDIVVIEGLEDESL
ncbi:uncharacterized protein (DUF1330 family) [Alteromonadaceae bacterium 2753L.S.0a.02]|nr:uncharacterized protein (DUF1330 family) [Alteromonadaceae bacterium 2753L.S.0a.02]